jgi:hypothetical protein
MTKAPRRARLEYHRSHLLYYRKHNGPVSRAALRVLLASRGSVEWLTATVSGDAPRRSDATDLLRLSLDLRSGDVRLSKELQR